MRIRRRFQEEMKAFGVSLLLAIDPRLHKPHILSRRMQDAGCKMQDPGYRIQDTGCRMQDVAPHSSAASARRRARLGNDIKPTGLVSDTVIRDARSRMQDARYRIQDAGCRMQDAGYRM